MTSCHISAATLWARFLIVATISIFISTAAFAQARTPGSPLPQKSADEFVRDVVKNETQLVDSDHSCWMYRRHHGFRHSRCCSEANLVKLKFVPNPQFDPPDREARVFDSMVGFMWVDRDGMRIAEITGKLTRDVDFGFGLLGHLYRGGTSR